ncbi:deoxyguanosinetriphosphate triphosphohydrolase [Desulfococcaceae bacterium OttesenSCG-928-F15]|nr:deoxyguanosinetriphosphate triphosphohydrolase [Desulfococcaceae bacterium OttesenSCG-928-F15]
MPKSIREDYEKREDGFLAPYAVRVQNSKGRRKPEPFCSVRTLYQQDRDRIVFSTGFRRLKHKTQVFLSPLGDHYRTRLTHTLEVAEVARTIARALRLNEDLTEAIAMAHDLGHTPFGHSGETVLKEIYSPHFSHAAQSLRVVDVLERHGEGLNLSHEVRDGIVKHSKGFGNILPMEAGEKAATLEGQVVRIADIIAYLNHDLDDAVRGGIIQRSQIPEDCVKILGETHAARSATMIRDLIFNSSLEEEGFHLRMSDAVFNTMVELRQFLFDNVYRAPRVHNEFVKASKVLSELFSFFMENENALKQELLRLEVAYDPEQPQSRTVCDAIASMTDRHALNLYQKIFMPTPML